MNERIKDIIINSYDTELSVQQNIEKLVLHDEFPVPLNRDDDLAMISELVEFIKEINNEIKRRSESK